MANVRLVEKAKRVEEYAAEIEGDVPMLKEKLPFPGAIDHGGLVTFTIFAPSKRTVHVIGDFNDWRLDATPLRDVCFGLWSTELELNRASYSYQFLIDGQLVITDPYARYIEEEPLGGGMRAIVKVRDEPFRWQHDEYDRPDFHDLLFYELHVADFTPERNFRGARKRLDYLRDHGVNAIELMPVFGHHQDTGWGYTPEFLFVVNKDFGAPAQLRALIDEAHGMGMAVILDMVLSHTGHKHPFNVMYPYDQSPWYGKGPRGGDAFALPQLDFSKPAARMYARDVLEYWLNDFHVDGFRFDYLSIVGVDKDGHGLPTLVHAARRVREDAFLIAEDLPEEPDLVTEAGFDGTWHVRCSHAMKALLLQGQCMAYDYKDFERCIRAFDPANEGYRNPSMMVNYVESHDEERLVYELRRAGYDQEAALRKSALGASVLLTLAGEPLLYQGEGWGEATAKNMEHNFIKWERLSEMGGKGLYEHYKRLCWFRRQHPGLRTANIYFDNIYPEQKCVVYHRWNDEGDIIVVVANFHSEPQTVPFRTPEPGPWIELFSGTQVEIPAPGDFKTQVDRWAAEIYTRPAK